MGAIKIKQIKKDSLFDIKDTWGRLCNLEGSDIFQSFEWALNWWNSYGYNKDLFTFVMTENNAPIGLAPLVITKEPFNHLPARKVELIYRMGLIAPFRKKETVKELFVSLKDMKKKWDMIDFSDMDCDDDIIDILERESGKAGLYFLLKEGDPYPYIDMDMSWEEYWNSRDGKFKRELRRCFRNMTKAGGKINININFYDTSRPVELKKAFEKIVALSLKSWKAKSSSALCSKRENEKFLKGLIDIFSKKGKVEISFLEYNGEPISGTLGIIHKDIFYGFKTYYDERFARLSPGNLLFHSLLKKLFSYGIKRAELLKGLFPQKLRWLTGMHKKAHVMIFRNLPYSRLLRFSETHLRPLVKYKNRGKMYVNYK